MGKLAEFEQQGWYAPAFPIEVKARAGPYKEGAGAYRVRQPYLLFIASGSPPFFCPF